MKYLPVFPVMFFTLLFVFYGEQGSALDEQNLTGVSTMEAHPQSSLVTVNIDVELGDLQKAASEVAQGFVSMGESLSNLANHSELTPKQRDRMNQVLSSIDQLSQNLSLTVEQLPDTVEKSIIPVVEAGHKLSSEIKWIVVITSVAIILIILAALSVAYYFVVAPGTKAVIQTASLLDELAKTLEKTAEIVESSSKQNLLVIENLQIMTDKRLVPPDQND